MVFFYGYYYQPHYYSYYYNNHGHIDVVDDDDYEHWSDIFKKQRATLIALETHFMSLNVSKISKIGVCSVIARSVIARVNNAPNDYNYAPQLHLPNFYLIIYCVMMRAL